MNRKEATFYAHGSKFSRLCLVFLLASFFLWTESFISAVDQKKKAEPYALLMGSCFNDKGFRLPGVQVLVELTGEIDRTVKKKKWQLLSSPRGEFAVRLPAGPHTYLVTASKKGFQPSEQTVTFQGDERLDIIFNMEPVPEEK